MTEKIESSIYFNHSINWENIFLRLGRDYADGDVEHPYCRWSGYLASLLGVPKTHSIVWQDAYTRWRRTGELSCVEICGLGGIVEASFGSGGNHFLGSQLRWRVCLISKTMRIRDNVIIVLIGIKKFGEYIIWH